MTFSNWSRPLSLYVTFSVAGAGLCQHVSVNECAPPVSPADGVIEQRSYRKPASEEEFEP